MGDCSVRSWTAEQGTAAQSTQGTKTLKYRFGEAAIRSPSIIFSLTLIHPLPKANKPGPFTGTWCQALLVLSIPPTLRQRRALPCEGRTSPTGHAGHGAASSVAGTPALVPSVSRRLPAPVSSANSGACPQPLRQLFYSNSSGFLTFCPRKRFRQTTSGAGEVLLLA